METYQELLVDVSFCSFEWFLSLTNLCAWRGVGNGKRTGGGGK